VVGVSVLLLRSATLGLLCALLYSILLYFLLLARYVPNVAKRSIWNQCKKYIYRGPTDRPTDQPHIWENFEWRYLREESSDPLHVWFYGGVFGVVGSNGAISGLTKFNRYVGKQCARSNLDWSQSNINISCIITRDVKSPPAHLYIAIFELVRSFDHRMMTWKFLWCYLKGKVQVKKRIGVNRYSHLRATRRHLPYGITQCYLPPDTSERAPP